MYQSAKSKAQSVKVALICAAKVAAMVLSTVVGVIIVVPVAAGAIVAWSAGMVFDALRPNRAGDDLV